MKKNKKKRLSEAKEDSLKKKSPKIQKKEKNIKNSIYSQIHEFDEIKDFEIEDLDFSEDNFDNDDLNINY